MTVVVNVYPRKPRMLAIAVNNALFWGLLVGTVGLSRVWFGGAWPIDVAALIMAFLGSLVIGMQVAGRAVKLSREQCAEWVKAGSPENVKAWLDNKELAQ